ncbi:pathogenesis-related protein 5-like isoform X2 [Carya illinoinensis]|uniref:pathogenesis-related protein 5-like isoform X2 n=1 Tax=Carya illinoinensis TaxID=32201 RepID=UPI001C720534|nr:pathogenesis-related protein 5-like isoform X2 [Carya illinoinensis]XP_042965889.1 pathogenesis-related protein 5-like isoform X2 [Carya illinoinensis]
MQCVGAQECSAMRRQSCFSMLLELVLGLMPFEVGSAAILSFENHCSYTVWPAIISRNGPTLGDGRFSLAPGKLAQLIAEPGWSGRVWARTGCNFDASGNGKCLTGDCGSLNCTGDGQPPITLAQIIIASGTTDNSFYDVSLVNGYNVGIGINVTSGTSDCQYAGCIDDLNGNCLPELQVVNVSGLVVACKSACEVFNAAQFCCADDYSTPETCSPTQYSEHFKKACPNAYSYPYDDVSSRFTCSGSNYSITFCPIES